LPDFENSLFCTRFSAISIEAELYPFLCISLFSSLPWQQWSICRTKFR